MAAAAPTGNVSIGRYQLEVGGAAGTLIVPLRGPPESDPAKLASALGEEPRTSGEAAEEILDDAAEVTRRVEQAVALLKDLATGGPVASDVPKRVDLLLEIPSGRSNLCKLSLPLLFGLATRHATLLRLLAGERNVEAVYPTANRRQSDKEQTTGSQRWRVEAQAASATACRV